MIIGFIALKFLAFLMFVFLMFAFSHFDPIPPKIRLYALPCDSSTLAKAAISGIAADKAAGTVHQCLTYSISLCPARHQ